MTCVADTYYWKKFKAYMKFPVMLSSSRSLWQLKLNNLMPTMKEFLYYIRILYLTLNISYFKYQIGNWQNCKAGLICKAKNQKNVCLPE